MTTMEQVLTTMLVIACVVIGAFVYSTHQLLTVCLNN